VGDLLHFPVKPRATLSKRQLARFLGRSTRWIELRTAEGWPASRDRNGERRYVLAEWLERMDEEGVA
jgi:hypothetical protein